MLSTKVHDQKMELLRAVLRNMYLQEKRECLDAECKMLAKHVLTCQVNLSERTDGKNALENELNIMKLLQEEKQQQLAAANEKILSISQVIENSEISRESSLHVSKAVKEELEMKNEMIKCLQEELVHVRLEDAEKYALIRELRQAKNELENDKAMLIRAKPETISRLQEELISLKLLENQYYVELDEIKKHLQNIKTQFQVFHENSKGKRCEGSVKLSKKGASWVTKDKSAEKKILAEIQNLEMEKMLLENRVPDLQSKLKILRKQIKIQNEIRCELDEKLEGLRIKIQSNEQLTMERRRQCSHLESSASEKVTGIRNSCKNKKQNIADLSLTLDEVSQRRESYSKEVVLKEFSTIYALEQEISTLEEKINHLKSENDETRRNLTNQPQL